MASLIVWHFADRAGLIDGTPLPRRGDELPEREVQIGKSGWHGTPRILDALLHATGPLLCLRELSGTVKRGSYICFDGFDFVCASRGRQLTDYADATDLLREFAEWCVRRVVGYGRTSAAAVDYTRNLPACRAADAASWEACRAARAVCGRDEVELREHERWLSLRAKMLLGVEA